MRKTLILSFMAGLLLLTGSSYVVAQDDSMRIIPVELFSCSYNDQKGPGDLDKVIDKWNAWADKKGIEDYAAWTLTPYYYGPDQEFDLIWLGAGKDAIALGKAQDAYLAEDAGLRAAFNDVLSCDAHVNFASFNFKAPPKGKTPENSVLTFSDCTYKEGASWSALAEAMGDWSKHLESQGSTTGIFHWYPAYGGGGEDFDFKWLQSYANFAELGADYERYGNGGGVNISSRLFNHMLDCDSTRAYLAKSRRFVQLR